MGERPQGALPCRTTVSTASELVFSPGCRHLLFPSLLPFYNHCPWSSMSQSCLVGQTPQPISSLLPPSPSSAAVPVPWAALKLSAPQTEVPFFLLIAFSLKARLSYHQNHSQMTGSDGLTSHVSNYHSGHESQMARLRWKCTSTQVRRTPGWMRPCVYGPVCPVTRAICSQEPCPICPLAPGHGKRPPTGRACRVHRDG